jgi:hypothetical protein
VSPATQRSLIALCVLLTVLGAAAGVTTLRLRRQVIRLQDERLNGEERERVLTRELARERAMRRDAADALSRGRSEAAVHPLHPGQPRAGTTSPAIAAGDRDALVVLELDWPRAPQDAPTYRAGLRSAPGDEFWVQSRLKIEPDRRVIVLRVPAAALPPADYELSVRGVTPGGALSAPVYYYFEVTSAPGR